MKRLCTRLRSSACRCAVVRPSFLPLSRWRIGLTRERGLLDENGFRIHAELQVHVRELLLHFAQRRHAEIAHYEELRLGTRHELADRLDLLAREAVGRA